MSANGEFDKWWDNSLWVKYNMAKTAPFEAWQTCQALNDKRIAELEAKLAQQTHHCQSTLEYVGKVNAIHQVVVTLEQQGKLIFGEKLFRLK